MLPSKSSRRAADRRVRVDDLNARPIRRVCRAYAGQNRIQLSVCVSLVHEELPTRPSQKRWTEHER